MIEADVADFVSGKVMILIASRDVTHRPYIGRGTGAAVDPGTGDLEVLVSASQWPGAASHAVPGSPIAATFVRPHDYCAYQIKGEVRSVLPADADQQVRGARYVRDMLAVLGDLGVSPIQLSSTLVDRDLLCIRFTPTDVFVQTPGPDAGKRLPMADLP